MKLFKWPAIYCYVIPLTDHFLGYIRIPMSSKEIFEYAYVLKTKYKGVFNDGQARLIWSPLK
jgi:hypothetical protein